MEIRGDVVETFDELVPNCRVEFVGFFTLLNRLAHFSSKGLVIHRRDSEADHGKVFWEQVGTGEIVEGGNEFSVGEIAGRSEDK